ncbi:hypothetical protein C8J57DRAFT_1059638 [Mycena rebaudengoi]|nr:hypothetical protein C8J57DRAFT_1059638 [Mycena rebaudengoi]
MANDDYLRRQLSLPPDVSVNLWAIAEVPGERPSVPLPILIKLAIHGSPEKKLTLQGICHELAQRFSWFKQHCRETAWKNSIRHNLSLNKVFRKIPLSVTQSGKGSYWQLDFSDGEGHKRLRKRGRAEQSDPQNSDSEQHHSDSRSHGSGNSPQPYRGEPLCPPTAADGSFGIMPKSTPDPTRDEPYIDPPARQNDRWK